IIFHAGLAFDVPDGQYSYTIDKSAILAQLNTSFDIVEKVIHESEARDFEEKVKFWNGPTTRRKLLSLTYDHITHHRAQAIVYLRMNDIKPPDYIGW
ncbi:MAG: DinB family protein, partial [Cyclobacteriaceae bacterium]